MNAKIVCLKMNLKKKNSGQFVSAERGQTHGLQGVPGLTSQESREVTFQKGRKLIEEVNFLKKTKLKFSIR